MNKRWAHFWSYFLHPAIFPILGVLVILKMLPYFYSSRVVILTIILVFLGTYILPLLISFLLLRLRFIQSLHMQEARHRRLPYLITALAFYFTAQSIQQLHIARESHLFLLGSALLIVLHVPLLFFFKPSAHLAGIGGFLGLLLALSLLYHLNLLLLIAAAIAAAGISASARLRLEAHTPMELWVGFLSGLALVGSTVYFFTG